MLLNLYALQVQFPGELLCCRWNCWKL